MSDINKQGFFDAGARSISVLPENTNSKLAKSEKEIQQDLTFFREHVLNNSPSNTQLAFSRSAALYNSFLQDERIASIPSDTHAVRQHVMSYLDYLIERGDSRSTIGIRLWAMYELHDKAGIQSNQRDLKRAISTKLNIVRPLHQAKQAKPLLPELLLSITKSPYKDVGSIRNKTIVNVAFDTLGRASEVAELRWSDLKNNTITIRKSKTDQEGKGRVCYLSGTSLRLLEQLAKAQLLHSDFIFRPLVNQHTQDLQADPNEPLSYQGILRGLRSAIKLTHEDPNEYSFHSTRVGAAVAMRAADIPMLEIMQAGGWASESMVLRYTKELDAQQSGASSLAMKLGR